MSARVRATVSEPRLVVPGPASDACPVPPGAANNNLDVADHGGRRYLAWRTANTHFAGSEPRLDIASTDGGDRWRHETTIQLGRDVREPRWFTWAGDLYLFFFTLGTRQQAFDPEAIHVMRLRDGEWSAPVQIANDHCVMWRVRKLEGRPVMSVYRGAGRLYTREPIVTTAELWAATDDTLKSWQPLDPDEPVFHRGGTETEVVEHPGGGIVAVTRIEGPEMFGSEIFWQPDLRTRQRRSHHTPRKFDSPLLWRHGDELLLIARRSLGFSGAFDLGLRERAGSEQMRIYHRVYWATPKRTTLWRIDPESLEAEPITDLTGWGDTCFPGIVRTSDTTYAVYNYTSPLDGPDLPWVAGQYGPTHIYEATLTIDATLG
jgi:hypothetical protein